MSTIRELLIQISVPADYLFDKELWDNQCSLVLCRKGFWPLSQVVHKEDHEWFPFFDLSFITDILYHMRLTRSKGMPTGIRTSCCLRGWATFVRQRQHRLYTRMQFLSTTVLATFSIRVWEKASCIHCLTSTCSLLHEFLQDQSDCRICHIKLNRPRFFVCCAECDWFALSSSCCWLE